MVRTMQHLQSHIYHILLLTYHTSRSSMDRRLAEPSSLFMAVVQARELNPAHFLSHARAHS
jgi:hypothetical protein